MRGLGALIALALLIGAELGTTRGETNGYGDFTSTSVIEEPAHGAGEPMEITHYCRDYEDCGYTGQPLGCGKQYWPDVLSSEGDVSGRISMPRLSSGLYDPYDPTIVAVGPSRYKEWPCGTKLRVCAQGNANRRGAPLDGAKKVGNVPSVQCVDVVRVDSCPGCGHYLIDLSEAAFEALGFTLEQGVGRVTVERME